MIDSAYHGVRGILSTYLVKGERAMVIDPGPTASIPGVVEGLEQLGVEGEALAYVAPTHIHLDHAGGAWRLLELFRDARLYVHPRGARHMIDPSRLEAAARRLFGDRVDGYGEVRGVPAERVLESEDGEVLDLGGVTVRVVWTPGHASHHQSYYIPE
jgi:glyoxylase-like metal-dependent hydrolase (beta-lactamase superfamily II)